MTKREVRIQLLADLDLPATGVLWDVGAGVGSVGLEALRLRPRLRLWALERRLGASLKQSNYNGLGSARAWFDKAQEQGIIRYGPDDESGAPTILPAEEEPPARPRRKGRS